MYDESCLKKLGGRIKLLRTVRGISQNEMAKALSISQTHLSNIENGRVTVNLRFLVRAANVFDCTLEVFFQLGAVETTKAETAYSSYSLEEVKQLLETLQLGRNTEKNGLG